MKIDANAPAYPVKEPLTCDALGLTIRAEIASRCLQAIVTRNGVNWASEIVAAGYAVKLADALIRELNKTASNGEGA